MSTKTPDFLELGPTSQYYVRLTIHIFLAVFFSVQSAIGINETLVPATFAKIALMAVVLYLPGYGPLKLRLEVSDVCQWVLFIASLVISVKGMFRLTRIFVRLTLADENALFPLVARLFGDYISFWWALSWNSFRRLEQVGSIQPIYLLFASLRILVGIEPAPTTSQSRV
ncbi:hypothetical protein C8F01DRAFT_1151272 [Mycena amicta]|nr:hypothetical protein C8F01DRAFT_1151272 [Mycena amicta]